MDLKRVSLSSLNFDDKSLCFKYCKKKKAKPPRYRPGAAQRVGRGIALLFHDLSTRRG
jgi:hypothetical protein